MTYEFRKFAKLETIGCGKGHRGRYSVAGFVEIDRFNFLWKCDDLIVDSRVEREMPSVAVARLDRYPLVIGWRARNVRGPWRSYRESPSPSGNANERFGSFRTKTVFPGLDSLRVRHPPCARAACSAIVSPMPIPGTSLPLKSGLTRVRRIESGTPFPLSCTTMQVQLSSRRSAIFTVFGAEERFKAWHALSSRL
jgi:hypothetical protein